MDSCSFETRQVLQCHRIYRGSAAQHNGPIAVHWLANDLAHWAESAPTTICTCADEDAATGIMHPQLSHCCVYLISHLPTVPAGYLCHPIPLQCFSILAQASNPAGSSWTGERAAFVVPLLILFFAAWTVVPLRFSLGHSGSFRPMAAGVSAKPSARTIHGREQRTRPDLLQANFFRNILHLNAFIEPV